MNVRKLSPRNLRPGIFVLAQFQDNDHHPPQYYLEIGIVRKDSEKLEILILSDAQFSFKLLPSFSAVRYAPFLAAATRTITIDECPLYMIDSQTVNDIMQKQQKHLEQNIVSAQAELEGFEKFRQAVQELQHKQQKTST